MSFFIYMHFSRALGNDCLSHTFTDSSQVLVLVWWVALSPGLHILPVWTLSLDFFLFWSISLTSGKNGPHMALCWRVITLLPVTHLITSAYNYVSFKLYLLNEPFNFDKWFMCDSSKYRFFHSIFIKYRHVHCKNNRSLYHFKQ